MALPKIDVPVYEMIVPSTGKTVKVRPFSVKEEKLLLIALESKDQLEIVNTVKQVVNNCLVYGEFDVDRSPFFDVDFLFIYLRAKSMGENVGVKLTCNNVLEDGEKCGKIFAADMDLNNVEVIKDDTIDNDISLGGDKGVVMKYPGYGVMKKIVDSALDIDRKVSLVVNSIDYIYDKDGTYSSKDHSKEELNDFVMQLTEENFRKMERFVDNFPTFAVKLEASCPKCGFNHKVRYTDFADFFL
ncbi:hypothetical protein EB001_15245 [bacterium]|nr:hypothetical protein [bacterium]